MTTLGEELPRQMARVRDKIMPAYIEIGNAGVPALTMMRMDLDRGALARAVTDDHRLHEADRFTPVFGRCFGGFIVWFIYDHIPLYIKVLLLCTG